MALKCGIIGLTNTGKTTLFNCMSSTKAQVTNFAFSTTKSNLGVVNVPDDRLLEIDKIIKAAKVVPATVEIVDIPGLTKGSSKGEGVGNSFLGDIRQTDALLHVLRCFDDPNLPHIEGSVNPVRDIEILEFELQIKDLEQLERKFEKVLKAVKVGEKDAKKSADTLELYIKHLQDFKPVRTLDVSEEQRAVVKDLCLLTEKPVLYICNVDDDSAVNGNNYVDMVNKSLSENGGKALFVAGKMEAEIAELDNPEDRKAFLSDMGLQEPSVNKVIREAYAILNYISFFTVGGKENRAWTIRRGMNAQQAAGVIHSDLERGFIRSEVIKYKDLIALGSELACREKGKQYVEGKTYIVEDGDILHIRFNV